jgi:succinate dehydrogenase/fumarate reductase cytochrome b subunit
VYLTCMLCYLPTYLLTYVAGIYGMGLGALAGVDVGSTMAALGDSSIGPLVKFAVAFPLSYHYLGGIRHLVSTRRKD